MALPISFFELTPSLSATSTYSPKTRTAYKEPASTATKHMSTFLELTPPPSTSKAATSATYNKKVLDFPIKFLELTPPLDAFKPLFSKHGLSTVSTTSEGVAHGFVELTPPLSKIDGSVKENAGFDDQKTKQAHHEKPVEGTTLFRAGAGMEPLEMGYGGTRRKVLQKRVDSATGLRNWPC